MIHIYFWLFVMFAVVGFLSSAQPSDWFDNHGGEEKPIKIKALELVSGVSTLVSLLCMFLLLKGMWQ